MARMPEKPAVNLHHDDIVAFWRDGVICVRQLYSADWRDRLADALGDAASGKGAGLGRMNMGSDYSEAYAWLWNDTIRDFVLDGPTAWIARDLFGSKEVNFYYDQIFMKSRQSANATPWHHDFTFWPLEGDQILSSWTSLDPVDAESSALEFIAGSHRWPQRFRAIGADGTDLSTDKGLSHVPDIEKDRDRYRVLSWSLEPGDALIFHALTLHGARGNASASRSRRAITTRWCGDDVTYRPRGVPFPYPHGLTAGDRLGGPFFPRVCPEIDEAAIDLRMQGPVLPDPSLFEEEVRKFAQANQDARNSSEPVVLALEYP
jgi:hypothetical protein